MVEKTVISTSGAPQNDRPYSQGIYAGEFLFISGQGPTDQSGTRVHGDIGEATRQTLRNVRAIVDEAGGSMADLVKVTVYLSDMDDYEDVNEAYGEFFNVEPPARVCIEVARMPGDIDVEIEATAHLG